MKKHGIEIATTDVLGNKIEPKLLVGDFNGYGSGEIFDANAVHQLVLQQIADLINLAPEALDTLGEIADVLNLKEDAIADLEEIRSGAALGATSYQKPQSGIPYSDMAEAVQLLLDKAGTALQSHQDISHKVDRNELEEVAFTGSYQSLSNKPFIPTLVSQLANDAGYLTQHQDISMKADRSELFSREYDDLLNKPVIPVVPENVGDFVNNVGYLTQHQDISGKQDVIADLETIRAGAALGATSIQQHQSLANYYTKGEVDTIQTTIEGEIPTKLSQLQNDPGYITAHQSLSDYLRIADLPQNLSSYNNDVPFLTQHQDISGKADKSETVTNVAYDTTNKKLIKTINNTDSDIVNSSTVVSDGITVVNNTPTLDWNTTSTIGSVQGTELKVKLPANPNTDTNTAALKVSDTTNKKINTVESPNSYIQFEGGTNEFTVKDGVNSFKVSVTPSITNNVTGSSLTANNIILGNGSSAIKDGGKSIESGANTTLSANDSRIPTSLVVKNYIDTSLTSVLKYKGTIGSSGATVTALPATHYVGWVYVVAKAGTFAGKACEVGDYIICRVDGTSADNTHWDVVNGENQVSSANNTATWGNAVVVGNVDGTDLKFTMPAKPSYAFSDITGTASTSQIPNLDASKITSGTFAVARIPSLSYVKLSDTEQTIESTIDTYSKGIVEFYRTSHAIALINFANKDSEGNKRTLGAIGFKADGIGDLMLRSGSTYYKIYNESNLLSETAASGGTTLSLVTTGEKYSWNNKYSSTTSRTANTVLAAPNGAAGAATFRALVAADIPSLAASKITSGTFAVARIPDLSGTYLPLTGGTLTGALGFNNNVGINMQDSANTSRSVMYMSTSNNLLIGAGSRAAGNTYIYGTNIKFRYGASGTNDGMILTTDGNIGIGTVEPAYKFEVSNVTDGTAAWSGKFFGENTVDGTTTRTAVLLANSGSNGLFVGTNASTNDKYIATFQKATTAASGASEGNAAMQIRADGSVCIGVFAATCSTAIGTAAKTATINGYTLVSGRVVRITFSNGNSVTAPTLNISSTGAKTIRQANNTALTSTTIAAGDVVDLQYDGTYYKIVGINQNIGEGYSLWVNSVIKATHSISVSKPTSASSTIFVENINKKISLYASTNGGIYDHKTSTWLLATNGTNTWLGQGNVAIDTAENTSYKLYVNGTVGATNFYTTSDRSKKENIEQYSEHISKFTLKETGHDAYGVIAQDVPEMFRNGEEGSYTVDYNSVLSYYVGTLENKVKMLEERLDILEKGGK